MPNIILAYSDVVLYEEDVKLLNDGHWLNDTCIEFYMEYIEKTKLASLGKPPHLFLLRPGLTYLIYSIEDTTFLASALPAELQTAGIIFLPINDNPNPTRAAGGSHWSLVVYLRNYNKFLHYDSAHGWNTVAARAAVKRIANVLGIKGHEFIEMDAPQQNNGTECGVYVIAIIDCLVNRLFSIPIQDIALNREMKISPGDILESFEIRRQLRALVEKLREKGGPH